MPWCAGCATPALLPLHDGGRAGAADLLDQDTVTFVADVAARTIRVNVEGSRLYPSVLVADRDINLCQMLDHIAVDAQLANTQGVYLLRPSMAQQQKRAIDEALDGWSASSSSPLGHHQGRRGARPGSRPHQPVHSAAPAACSPKAASSSRA